MSLFKKNKKYSFDIVGLPYYREEQAQVKIDKHTVIEVVEEPENEYDKNAIRVEMNGHKVGHVPARQCKLVKGVIRNASITSISTSVSVSDGEWISARVTINYKE